VGRLALLLVLLLLPAYPVRAQETCGGCLRSPRLTSEARALYETFQRALKPDGRTLCLYDDGAEPNAHVHPGERPFAIHVGLRYFRQLVSAADDDPSLAGRMEAFYNAGATVFHEYGHTLADQLQSTDSGLAQHVRRYGHTVRDTIVVENYADCITGVVLGGASKHTARVCDATGEQCLDDVGRSWSVTLGHALFAGARRTAFSTHGSPANRYRMVSYGIFTASPEERTQPREASGRCLAHARVVADEQLSAQPTQCTHARLSAQLAAAINGATRLLSAPGGRLLAREHYLASVRRLDDQLPECHARWRNLEAIARELSERRPADDDFEVLDANFRAIWSYLTRLETMNERPLSLLMQQP
jgi:hypothetical protein